MRLVIRKIAALVLLLAFAGQTFSQGIILIQFHIRRAYIIKTECINRYRPMLHCDGKCALARKLAAQDKKEQQQPELKAELKQEVFRNDAGLVPAPPQPVITSLLYKPFSVPALQDRSADIFHPPGR